MISLQCDLQQSGVVGVVVLIVSFVGVHLVALTGSTHFLGVVQRRRVQAVGVDQTHQVLPVVFPVDTSTHTILLRAPTASI